MGRTLSILAALAISCASAPHGPVLPSGFVDDGGIERPNPGDPRRYGLAAWGTDYLLEFRVPRSFSRPEFVLRVYPRQTVCLKQKRRTSLFSFRDGSPVPDEGMGLEPGVTPDEVETGKAQFEVLGVEKFHFLRGLEPTHMQIVGSTSLNEANDVEQALALSGRRAQAVAEYVRKARPDLSADQVDIVALGWDGFATEGDPKSRVVFVPLRLSSSDLPIIYTGPAVSEALQARILNLLEPPGDGEYGAGPGLVREIAYSPSFDGHGDDARRQKAALFEPVFAAWEEGCRLPEREFAEALEAFALPSAQPEPVIDIHFVPQDRVRRRE